LSIAEQRAIGLILAWSLAFLQDLFTKMKNEFGETTEVERKVEQLKTIEQGGGHAMSMYKSSKRLSKRVCHKLHLVISPSILQ